VPIKRKEEKLSPTSLPHEQELFNEFDITKFKLKKINGQGEL